MTYEGKIYEKINGKYIELNFPQNLIEHEKRLVQKLDELATESEATAKHFNDNQMTISARTSEAMAIAYRNVKRLVLEKQI